jgi:hypothetical protein
VRSLNFFQGMALVSAGGDVSPQDFAGFLRFAVACGRQRDAGHSRLISFIFCVERTIQTRSATANIFSIGNCIRVLARFCSTSRQACTVGSDLG